MSKIILLNGKPIDLLCKNKQWKLLAEAILDPSFPKNFRVINNPENFFFSMDTRRLAITIIEALKINSKNIENSDNFLKFLDETKPWFATQKRLETFGSITSNDPEINEILKKRQKKLDDWQKAMSSLQDKSNKLNKKRKITELYMIVPLGVLILSSLVLIFATSPVTMVLAIAIGIPSAAVCFKISNNYSKILEQSEQTIDAIKVLEEGREKICNGYNMYVDSIKLMPNVKITTSPPTVSTTEYKQLKQNLIEHKRKMHELYESIVNSEVVIDNPEIETESTALCF